MKISFRTFKALVLLFPIFFIVLLGFSANTPRAFAQTPVCAAGAGASISINEQSNGVVKVPAGKNMKIDFSSWIAAGTPGLFLSYDHGAVYEYRDSNGSVSTWWPADFDQDSGDSTFAGPVYVAAPSSVGERFTYYVTTYKTTDSSLDPTGEYPKLCTTTASIIVEVVPADAPTVTTTTYCENGNPRIKLDITSDYTPYQYLISSRINLSTTSFGPTTIVPGATSASYVDNSPAAGASHEYRVQVRGWNEPVSAGPVAYVVDTSPTCNFSGGILRDDTFVVTVGTTRLLNVLANDFAPQQPVTQTIALLDTQPTRGTATVSRVGNPASYIDYVSYTAPATKGPDVQGIYNDGFSYYGISSDNVQGSATALIDLVDACTVTFQPPNPSSNIQSGDPVTLSWSSTNVVTNLTPGGAWAGSGSKKGTDSQTITVPSTPGNYTYSLTGANAAGDPCNGSITIPVVSVLPPIDAVDDTFPNITPGSSNQFDVLLNDTYSTLAPGGFRIVTPLNQIQGSPSVSSNKITYSAPANPTGPDSFVYEITDMDNQPDTATVKINFSTPPTQCSINLSSGSGTTVTVGGSVTLSWSTSNVQPNTLTKSGQWTGSESSLNSSRAVTLPSTPGSYTYSMSGQNTSGTPCNDSITITVIPVQACSINFVAPSSATFGENVVFSWRSTNVTGNLTASGSWSGTQSANVTGTSVTMPTTAGNYTYTLSGQTSGGNPCSDSVTISVTDPGNIACGISLQGPGVANTGQTVRLSWGSTYVTGNLTASGSWSGIKAQSSTGTDVAMPSTPGTYTYTLSGSNSYGSQCSASKSIVVSTPASACSILFTATGGSGSDGTAYTAYTNQARTLNFETTGVVGNITASGDWSGTKTYDYGCAVIGGENVCAGYESAPIPGSPGTKTYTVSGVDSNGQSCSASLDIQWETPPSQPTVSPITVNVEAVDAQTRQQIPATWNLTVNGVAQPKATNKTSQSYSISLSAPETRLIQLTPMGAPTGYSSNYTVKYTTSGGHKLSFLDLVKIAEANHGGTGSSVTGYPGDSITFTIEFTSTTPPPSGTCPDRTLSVDACDDTAKTQEDTPVPIYVTANDQYISPSPADRQSVEPLSIQTAPSHGTAVASNVKNILGYYLNPGNVTYTPDPGFSGTDTFYYTLTLVDPVTGSHITDTARVTVTITPGAASNPPNVNLNATDPVDGDQTVVIGGDVNVGWSVTNATSCTASSNPSGIWSGSKNSSGGTEVVRGLTQDTTFTLNCTGPDGTDAAFVLVRVSPAECSDSIDNDGDTFVDFPNDPDCTGPSDDSEAGTVPECADGIDNDGDAKVDDEDPRCHLDGNSSNPGSYDSSDNNESPRDVSFEEF